VAYYYTNSEGALTPDPSGNGSTKQGLSKAHVLALWAALGTMLTSQVVPAVMDYISEKPSAEQVQTMIAKQTEALTNSHNEAVEAMKQLRDALVEVRKDCEESDTITSKLEGRTAVMRDVIGMCCSRRAARERLDQPVVTESPKPTLATKAAKAVGDFFGAGEEEEAAPAVKALAPVPDFTQQQTQVQAQ